MRQGVTALVALVAVAILVTACDDSASPGQPTRAARTLRDAARRTAAESTFRVRMDTIEGGKHHSSTAEYQAPDRTVTRAGRTATVQIGPTMYLQLEPDRFTRATMTGPGSKHVPSPFIDLLGPAIRPSGEVTTNRNRYTITKRTTNGTTRTTFRVVDHRVTDVTMDWSFVSKHLPDAFTTTYHYFDFGTPITVEPPPPDQVEESTTLRCPKHGELPLPADSPAGGCFETTNR